MAFESLPFTFDMVPAAISMAGSVLVSRYDRWSYAGWALWLVGNVIWIGWAFTAGAAARVPVWGVALQNVFFLGTSIKELLNSRRGCRQNGTSLPQISSVAVVQIRPGPSAR